MANRDSKPQLDELAYQLYFNTESTKKCVTFDIGDRCGHTGYIDFIRPNEFTQSVVKGMDKFARRFVTFRANIVYEDGKITETFMTLFQRYTREERLWMGAGRDRPLFATDGGTNAFQLQLLIRLFNEISINLTEEDIKECRLEPHSFTMNESDLIKPIKITLVGSDIDTEATIKPTEKVEDVMKDLEEKINPKSVSEGLAQLATAIKTNDPSIILAPMEAGAKEFEERVGRPMTYGEMRAMWG